MFRVVPAASAARDHVLLRGAPGMSINSSFVPTAPSFQPQKCAKTRSL